MLFVSGHIAKREGKPWSGQLGQELTTVQGKEAARGIAIDLLGTMHTAIGDLNRVQRIVKLMVLVTSAPNFTEQHLVANGASELFRDVFGEKGAHARSAFGVAQIPFGSCLEIELIAEVDWVFVEEIAHTSTQPQTDQGSLMCVRNPPVKSVLQRQHGTPLFSIAFAAVFCALVLISMAQGRAQRIPALRTPDRTSANGCARNQLLNFEIMRNGELVREVPVSQLSDSSAFFFEAGMSIDADGAPNAYHPENRGLDDLANAGGPGNWQGVAHDRDGEPFVQGADDPYPGYYVSTTALSDRSKSARDPARYVDASKIPYIALPRNITHQVGARLGDFAVVFNLRNGKSSYAIFADVGPPESIGEGSIALAENLGIRSDARRGGARDAIIYLVFPGSGNGRPRSLGDIYDQSEKLFETWGGMDQITACAKP